MTSNRSSMLKKFNGSEEQYLAWMRENAAKGGRKKVPKGMASLSPEERSQRGRDRALRRWKKVGNDD